MTEEQMIDRLIKRLSYQEHVIDRLMTMNERLLDKPMRALDQLAAHREEEIGREQSADAAQDARDEIDRDAGAEDWRKRAARLRLDTKTDIVKFLNDSKAHMVIGIDPDEPYGVVHTVTLSGDSRMIVIGLDPVERLDHYWKPIDPSADDTAVYYCENQSS